MEIVLKTGKTMKLLRTKHLSLAVLLMTGAAFTACSSSEDDIIGQSVNPTESEVFTMTIQATKGEEATTRALSLEGNILSATWAEGEEVTVYNETKKEELTGTLKAQSSGASTTLKGEISGSIDANDVLTLKFLSPNYDSQEGTLEYIAAHCDYATASVTVTGVDGGDISTGTANFVNQQAIVRFELSKPNGYGYEGLYTRSVKIVADNEIITVTLSAETNDVYVALPAISGKKLVIGASSYSDNDKYYYIKSTASFQSGKYYSISVKMKDGTVVFNESELNSAISDNAPYIVLGCDIPLSNCVQVNGDKNIVLDLCLSILIHLVSRQISP